MPNCQGHVRIRQVRRFSGNEFFSRHSQHRFDDTLVVQLDRNTIKQRFLVTFSVEIHDQLGC